MTRRIESGETAWTLCLLWVCLAVTPGPHAAAREAGARRAPEPAEHTPTPLRTVSAAPFSGQSFFGWAGQALCDQDENVYFLVVRPLTRTRVDNDPRDVLRVSADGKRRMTFDPAAAPKLANAAKIATAAMALDPDGGLSMAVWARWDDRSGSGEKSGQFIVSFDQKGEHRSTVEVDDQEIVVRQFEVFGTGQLLLHGRRPDRPEPRLAILSPSGGALRDVVAWAGLYKALEEPSPEDSGPRSFDQMARGGDGRVYVAQADARPGEDVVYAFRPSGDVEEVFTLRAIPKAPHLLGFEASGDRFAVSYLSGERKSEGSSGARNMVGWIAVYTNPAGGGEAEPTLYGPVPGPALCYRHEEAGDRFTFLKDGKLVTMAAR